MRIKTAHLIRHGLTVQPHGAVELPLGSTKRLSLVDKRLLCVQPQRHIGHFPAKLQALQQPMPQPNPETYANLLMQAHNTR
eukprot:2250947-Amphidinium_carterae.2